MTKQLRLTPQTLLVLEAIMDRRGAGISGAEITKTAKLKSGTLYPILTRLEEAGWLSSEWEDVDPSEIGRPRRRLYKVTSVGIEKAQKQLTDQVALTRRVARKAQQWA